MPDIFNNPWIAFAIVLVCLIFSAFFSASETALTAASKAGINALNNQGNANAGIVMRLLQARERLIGSILIGNNIVNIGASAFMTSVLVELFGAGGVLYATIIMSTLVIVFAEVLPKSVAISTPDRFALGVAKPIAFFVAFFGPLTNAVNGLEPFHWLVAVKTGH